MAVFLFLVSGFLFHRRKNNRTEAHLFSFRTVYIIKICVGVKLSFHHRNKIAIDTEFIRLCPFFVPFFLYHVDNFHNFYECEFFSLKNSKYSWSFRSGWFFTKKKKNKNDERANSVLSLFTK